MPHTPSAEIDLSAVTRLPLRVRHGRFETAISLLNRQALRSGYRDMDHLLRRVPGLPRQGRYPVPHLVAIAARVNDCDEGELAASSVARVGASFELGGAGVLSGRLAVQGRVCIGCLRGDAADAPEWRRPWSPFLRDWWQVAQIGSCPWHELALTGSCPGCGEPLDMRRPSAARCRCGTDLLACEPDRLTEAEVSADAYLLGRIGRGPARPAPLLDALDFGSAAGLMLNLGVSLDPGVPFNRTWTPGNAERSRHASRGMAVLARGWAGVDGALDAVREISSADRRTYKLVGRYGRLQHWLGMQRTTDLEPFRERLVMHARRHGAASDSTVLFGSKLTGAERMTMNAASTIIGRHPGPIYRMLTALGLGDQATGDKRHDIISSTAIQPVKLAFDEAIDSTGAKALLGLNKKQLARYVAAGVLEEFCPGAGTSSSFFRQCDVEHLAAMLMGGLDAVDEPPPGTILLGLANGIAKLGDESVTRAILEGRVRRVAIKIGEDGVRSASNVLVSRSDVTRLRRESGRPFTMTEAAPLLHLHRFTLGKLCQKFGLAGPNGLLDASDLLAIRKRFVTLSEIAAACPHLGSHEFILAQLAAAGLTPALDDGWCKPLFDRAEVAHLVGSLPEEPLPPELAEANSEVVKPDAIETRMSLNEQ